MRIHYLQSRYSWPLNGKNISSSLIFLHWSSFFSDKKWDILCSQQNIRVLSEIEINYFTFCIFYSLSHNNEIFEENKHKCFELVRMLLKENKFFNSFQMCLVETRFSSRIKWIFCFDEKEMFQCFVKLQIKIFLSERI